MNYLGMQFSYRWLESCLLISALSAFASSAQVASNSPQSHPPIPNIWRDAPATPERMKQRLADAASQAEGYDPVPRVMLYDIGYPHSPEEYSSLGGMAVLLVTAVSHVKDELPLKNVRIVVGEDQVELKRIKSVLSDLTTSVTPTTKAFGPYRQDALYLLPMKLRNQHSALTYDYSERQSNSTIAFAPLPEHIARLVQPESQSAPTDQYLAEFTKREFPSFFGE